MGDLRYAHELHPFSGVQIVSTEPVQNFNSPPEGVPMREWLAAIGLETVKERVGSWQMARSIVLKYGNGNGKRILESLAEASPTKRQPLTMEDVQESFRKSTLLQTSQSS
jgi:hypothetical protein